MMWRWAGAGRAEAERVLSEEEPSAMDASLAQRLDKISRHQILPLTHSGRRKVAGCLWIAPHYLVASLCQLFCTG